MNIKDFITIYMKIKKILKKYRQSVEMLGIKRSFLEGIKLFINPFSKKIFFNYIDYEKAFEVLNSIKNEEIHKFKVSFIIPTYNGMDKGLPDLIDSIKNQSFRNIEIIAVDSGSSDGTVEYLLKRGVKVIKIKKTEFRHDYARNVGAEEASGDFLVFTVQDAQFEDRKWVEIGIKSLIGFNCDSFTTPQIPKPNHDIYAAYLSQNFIKNNNYKSGLIIVNRLKILSSFLFSTLSYKSREAALHIDNTNHMVRKETYLKIKYNLQTCEDMDFAKRLIKSGKRWIYSTLTYVLHSHFYNDYFQYFSRVFVDAIEINKMLFNLGFKKKVKPYIYDCLVFLFILFVYSIDCVQRKLIFNLFKNTKLTDLLVIITNKGNTLLVDINKKLYINSFQFITEISNFIRTYLNNQFDFFILLEKKRFYLSIRFSFRVNK